MVEFKYMVRNGDEFHYFKNLADSWTYADQKGLERPPRIKETDSRHPYLRGPAYWQKHLMFWHQEEKGKMKYSQSAKDYYDGWLSAMFKNERINTRIQNGLQ